MGRLKISPNLFLEVNELNRLIQFIGEGYKPILSSLIKTFGVLRTEDNTYFKVSYKDSKDIDYDRVTVNSGIAFDSDLNRIYLPEAVELEIEKNSSTKWVLISYSPTSNEEGTVTVSSDGSLTGVNTKFTSVLRGQPNFPTKVRFDSENNTGEYEVVNVISDTEALLSGSFSKEEGVKYQVIGTFTPGFQPNDDDKTIYEYDSCTIETVDLEYEPELSDNQYLIAKIWYEDGVINISDERSLNMFNAVEVEQDLSQEDKFVAIRRISLWNEKTLDVQFEWGYTVKEYELINSADNNIFKIITGQSKYISSAKEISDGDFKGFLLVNRKNMVSAVINDNQKGELYISVLNPNIITEQDDEFVIVPNAKEIEIEVALNNESTENAFDYGDTKHFFRFSIENAASRFCFPLEYGKTAVGLRFRLIDSNETSPFMQFANREFTNLKGENEKLINSSFTVTLNKPEVEQRNYS